VLNHRRRLLSYLRRANFPRYAFMLRELGLKDVYAQQARLDKYRVGTRLGAAAEPLKWFASNLTKERDDKHKKKRKQGRRGA
jgi:small subunit ribosomal protein S15